MLGENAFVTGAAPLALSPFFGEIAVRLPEQLSPRWFCKKDEEEDVRQ